MNSPSSSHNTIDVRLFFNEITKGYSELANIIRTFSDSLAHCSPQEITAECNKIQSKRDQLSLMDQQLNKIAQLASSEIQGETFVDDYRTAFKEAITACENLHTSLLITKAELLSPPTGNQPN